MNLKVAVAALFFITTFSHRFAVNAQVTPSATQNGLVLKVGAGFSDYAGNLNNGQLQGGALWVDFVPPRMPSFLRGFGLEAEARGVTASDTLPTQPGAFRQSTVGGGPTYTYLRYPRFHPYAKFIVSYAGQSYNLGGAGDRQFETQTAYAPGGGIDYRAYSNLWVRGDYEYQFWPDAFGSPNWYLDPHGITLGLAWEFKPRRRY
jgi:hypothetical protein